MTVQSIPQVSLFWTRLDEVRALLRRGAADEASRLFGALGAQVGQIGHLSGALPPALAARRREMLDRFAELHGLEVPAPSIDPSGPLPLDDFVTRRLPGISLVTCCMNRNENLIRALPSWLAQDDLSEIVVVDWSSDRPVAEDIRAAGLADPRLRVARVEGETRWILSYAFNAGFRLARYDRILKADADIVLAPDFFSRNPLRPGAFIAGNWRCAAEGQAYVNGFFYVHHDALMGVKGFNEHITTYGWDDDELYDRLVQVAELVRTDVDPGSVSHLEHDDAERFGPGDAAEGRTGWDDLVRLPIYKIRTNRFIATIMPGWDRHRQLLPIDILAQEPGQLVLRRHGPVPHQVPAHIAETARRLAAYELLSWQAGLRVWDLDAAALDTLLGTHRLEEIRPADVERALAGTRGGTREPAARESQVVAVPPEVPRAAAERLPAPALPAARAPGLPPALATAPAPAPAISPAISPGRERIFIDAQHGLGNRLRAIGSAAAVAEATGRELVVVWQPDHHCEGRLSDLFDYPGAVIETSFPAEARTQGATMLNYIEVEPDADKDAALVLEAGRDAYLRSAYVINHPASTWETSNRFLRALVPSEPVRDLVAQVPATHADIGLHIRMEGAPGTDRNSYDRAENWTAEGHAAIHRWRSASHWSRFVERLGPELERNPDARMFLAADMAETYAAFAERFGDRVAVLERTLWDRSTGQLRYALADILCLARCRTFFGSNWSSFSEIALRMSSTIRHSEMSGTDF